MFTLPLQYFTGMKHSEIILNNIHKNNLWLKHNKKFEENKIVEKNEGSKTHFVYISLETVTAWILSEDDSL